MKLLLLGKDGQVGRALQRRLMSLGAMSAYGRPGVDFEQPGQVASVIALARPDVIVNAAAYTAVDAAEEDRARAWAVNAEALEVIGRSARATGAFVVHYSTDYVYSGMGKAPQSETDPTSPLSVYGASKLAGEVLLRESGAKHVIFRTSWVYASKGKNFPLTILRLARERDTLTVVSDQVGAPTSADLIADITARVIPDAGGHEGTYNLAATGATSWHGLARFIVAEALAAGARLKLTPDAIVAIPSSQYPAKAARPANSRLDTKKLRDTFSLALPPWQDGIRQLISALKEEGRL